MTFLNKDQKIVYCHPYNVVLKYPLLFFVVMMVTEAGNKVPCQ